MLFLWWYSYHGAQWVATMGGRFFHPSTVFLVVGDFLLCGDLRI